MTISRGRNGTILHRFPSALPNGSSKDTSSPESYSILIVFFTRYLNQTHFLFHSAQATCTHSLFLCLFFNIFILLVVQPDETYYIIDMICWRGYSMHDYAAEFRFFWLNSKLTETSAGDPPSAYHRYKFGVVPIYECTLQGLQAAYLGTQARPVTTLGHDVVVDGRQGPGRRWRRHSRPRP